VREQAKGVAWEELVALEPALRTWLVRRCRDAGELDDVVQETILRAARFRARGRDPRRFSAWLSRIATNALHDWVRRESRARQHAQADAALDQLAAPDLACESPPDAGDEPYQLGAYVVTKDVAQEQLAAVLREMRADDRQLLCAFYGGEQRCADAARECGLPIERVKVRLFRARRRLTRELSRRMALVGRRKAAGSRI
jgi:RNA polymerase sigma-70 factor (ECF subfamily)